MGNKDAQYDLGRALLWGFGCEENPSEALTWFRLAAAQGHTEAEYESGIAYATGRGCPTDLRQAQQRLKRGARCRTAAACVFPLAG